MQVLNHYLLYIYRCFPPFNLGDAFIKLSVMDLQAFFTGVQGNLYEWNKCGRPLLLMAVEARGIFWPHTRY